ncbi:glycosyltransferase family 2 protein [Plantibacter sp. Mn2098]|uniref:glycosyltransferase family 2 protein n=1 Tax=Plantibacter sp. Mn2098 TaxID=3395266 RepID=UPI003BD66B2F
MSDLERLKIMVVIPSISPARFDHLRALVEILESIGASVVVIANSKRLLTLVKAAEVRHVTSHSNDGFAASMKLGADSNDSWDWLMILNDDVTLDKSILRDVLAEHLRNDVGVVYLDAENARPVPGRLGAFLNISLVGRLLARQRKRSAHNAVDVVESGTYKSFSAVAVSRRTWTLLDGLDLELPFTYEDADFARRSNDAQIRSLAVSNSGVFHEHSATTSAWIEYVLPVSTWSAYQYLRKWYRHPRLSQLICVSALVVRVCLVPMASAPNRAHLRGVWAAIRAIAFNSKPDLPPFESV